MLHILCFEKGELAKFQFNRSISSQDINILINFNPLLPDGTYKYQKTLKYI